ncbi:MAG: 4-alpha-glucanotransferase [Gammaproteobacteria bacterium]|nr:4-alpha-glucanotransferase [Gammaproteobacteria bacterium]
MDRPQDTSLDFSKRRAGVCLHFSSLPGHYGIGEIGDEAFRFVDEMVRMNLRVWQFLPTGPTGYGDSPYQPLSVFAGNELLIEMANLIRFGLVSSIEADSLLKLPRRHVDFGKLVPRKQAVLLRAAGRFETHARSSTKEDFDRFLDKHNDAWLHDYAVFRLLKTAHGEKPWPAWAPEFVHREPAAMEAFCDAHATDLEYLKIIQFIFHRQWQHLRDYAHERGVLLMGDLPIYIALDSADAWAHPELLEIDDSGMPGRVAGVPPDYFSAGGQLWGNPLYDWDYHARTGFEWWIARLRRALYQADVVRIDHFRGLESYWSIPAGETTARNGEWLPGPAGKFLDAVRHALGGLPLVAEDLGYITPEVNALRDRYQLPGMRVLQFDIADPAFVADRIPERCVCYTGTHDNDTTLGWFRGSPGDLRSPAEIASTQARVLQLTGGTAETMHRDLIRYAFATRAGLVIAPLQDYLGLGSEARFNLPGTIGNNWRWRYQKENLSRAAMDSIAEWVNDGGRSR